MLGQEFLRGATMEQLDAIKDKISEEDYKRARYVIGEEKRVLDVCDALEKGDYETVGKRMYETHWGMSKDYEVSCEELDFLVEGCRGVRCDGFAHHGRRLRRLHDQPGEGRALRQLHRHGQREVQREVRPRTQGLRRRDFGRFAPFGIMMMGSFAGSRIPRGRKTRAVVLIAAYALRVLRASRDTPFMIGRIFAIRPILNYPPQCRTEALAFPVETYRLYEVVS